MRSTEYNHQHAKIIQEILKLKRSYSCPHSNVIYLQHSLMSEIKPSSILKTSLYFMYTFYCFYSMLYFYWKISFRIKAIHSQTSLKWGQKENSRRNQHFKSYFTFSIMTLSAASQYEILLLYFTKCVTFFAVLRTSHSGGAAILRCRSSITGVRSFQTK